MLCRFFIASAATSEQARKKSIQVDWLFSDIYLFIKDFNQANELKIFSSRHLSACSPHIIFIKKTKKKYFAYFHFIQFYWFLFLFLLEVKNKKPNFCSFCFWRKKASEEKKACFSVWLFLLRVSFSTQNHAMSCFSLFRWTYTHTQTHHTSYSISLTINQWSFVPPLRYITL